VDHAGCPADKQVRGFRLARGSEIFGILLALLLLPMWLAAAVSVAAVLVHIKTVQMIFGTCA
jgi:hypothetical protein